jgi:ectoine hydroxylase-related dioxygenase (phytanoyl-CoA dioxygenase family)
MSDRVFINEDGSVRDEIVAEREAAMASSAERHGVDAAQVDGLIAEVEERGYVIIPELMPRDVLENMRREVQPLLTFTGRNEFEGHRTRRIYSVIEKTLSINPFIEHPLILALLDRLLMPRYLLSQVQAIDVLPGEVAQPLHADDGFYPIPRPRKAISAATIWAIDDFTADNGATVIIPGSHRWGDQHPGDGSGHELVPAVMSAGSVLFFVGTAWHGAGANRSDASRMAVTAQYCEPWARQQENFSLSISRERARLCSERIQAMLGYSMMFPFIGFVDGRDPRRLLNPR